jgi:NitT/TauT family transport system substrate-binding protein
MRARFGRADRRPRGRAPGLHRVVRHRAHPDDRGAQACLDLGFRTAPEYAWQAMRGRWREFSPEDPTRFYALRLREVRLINSSLEQLIAMGADSRFIDQLKKELKT